MKGNYLKVTLTKLPLYLSLCNKEGVVMSNGFRSAREILMSSDVSNYTLHLVEIFSISDGKMNTLPE